MEQHEETKQVEPIIFRSIGRNLVLGLSRLYRVDENNRRIYFPKMSFQENVLKLIPGEKTHRKGEDFPNDALIKLIRESVGNKANGGEDFWEETPAQRAMMKTGGFYAELPPGGFSETDFEYLKFFDGAQEKLSNSQKDWVYERVEYFIERFNIQNVKRPNKFYNLKRLKAWIQLFMGDLEEFGISYSEALKGR